MEELQYWRKCGPCKKHINYGMLYYKCSVSTCHKNAFCSKACWSVHVPVMRHKDAWPEEVYAPAPPSIQSVDPDKEQRRRIVAASSSESMASDPHGEALEQDILIVASKLKQYIKAKSQMNTSGQVMERLSDIVRSSCDRAIQRAREAGRKTVMDRDFEP